MTGERCGLLVVLSLSHVNEQGYACWRCQCACGATKVVNGHDLRRLDHPTRSCGCLTIEAATETIAEVNRRRRAACIRALFTTGLVCK